MAIGRNIPQEQAMLSQLPDELLESGLQEDPGKSPFTQFLGAIEMTKRVKQRKSAAQTLAGQNGQPGTVVGRMVQQGSQVGPAQQAPSFMNGGQVPGKPQSEYNFSQPGADSPSAGAPGRDSMTMQHRTSPNRGGNVAQQQLALNRSPQSLAHGGEVKGEIDIHQRHKIQGPENNYKTLQDHRQAVAELKQPRQSFGIGGMVAGMASMPGAMIEGEDPMELMKRASPGQATGGIVPQQSLASGGMVGDFELKLPIPFLAEGGRVPQIRPSYATGTTRVLSELEQENARRAALGMPPIPSPANLPLTQDSEFDPAAYADQSALIGGPETQEVIPAASGPAVAPHNTENQMWQGEAAERARRAAPGFTPFNPNLPPSSEEIIQAGGTDALQYRGQELGQHARPFVGIQPGVPRGMAQSEYAQFNEIQDKVAQEKIEVGLDTATAEEFGESEDQRSARFRRASALGAMAASFGSNSTFFKGLTGGVADASQIMQEGDSEKRTRDQRADTIAGRQYSATQMLKVRAQDLRNDLAQGVAGTQIKMTELATESVKTDLENGVSEMPEDAEAMNRLVMSKMVSLFGRQRQQAESTESAVLGTKE